MTTWLTPLRAKCRAPKSPGGGAESTIIQKELLYPHWPWFHNLSPQTQMKIQLVLCKLLNMCQSLQSSFCVCGCVCDYGRRVFFCHLNMQSYVLHNFIFSIDQAWGYEKNRISCDGCGILNTVNAVFHFFWEFLPISWVCLWSSVRVLKASILPHWNRECF